MAAHDRYRLAADAWLGGILGRRAWTVAPDGATPISELRAPGPHFATAKLNPADTEAAADLQAYGFRIVDTALTLECESPASGNIAAGVRFARPEDRSAVEVIAGSSFRYSRFHLDPQIPKALADKVKAAWAGNWFKGQRGDGMVVAEDGGEVAGFLQLLRAGEQRLVIDLIAVRPQSARKGLARGMIGFARANGTGDARRPAGMIVGTQAVNAPSLRLYESLGFRVKRETLVLHHHGATA